MKHAYSFSVAVSVLLLSFALPGGELRSAVKEKTRLSKVFEGKSSMHSTAISLRVDGNAVESPMSAWVVNLEDTTHVELHDVYGAVKGGKPETLRRSFDKIEGKSTQHVELPEEQQGQGPADTNQERKSELEGKTVVFSLGEGGEYKVEFDDGKGEAALLEKLEEDMDLRALLPDGAVEVDKSWEIDVPAFYAVLNLPGGRLKLKAEGEEGGNAKFSELLEENAKGKAKGTYKGEREVDGRKYALVAFEAELTTEGERDDSGRTPPGGTTDVKVAHSVEGELLWDTESGHFHSLKLESKITLTMKSTRKMEHGGESHELERTTEFEGEHVLTASIVD